MKAREKNMKTLTRRKRREGRREDNNKMKVKRREAVLAQTFVFAVLVVSFRFAEPNDRRRRRGIVGVAVPGQWRRARTGAVGTWAEARTEAGAEVVKGARPLPRLVPLRCLVRKK